MDHPAKLHYCTDIPLQYRYRKIKSVINALGIEVTDCPRQTFADLRSLTSIPILPILQTSQGNFTSSNTIIRYLASKLQYKLYGGQNLYHKALIDQWLDILQNQFDSCAMAVNLYLDGKEIDIQAVTADAQKFMSFLNKHLKNRKFVVGQELSIADLAIAATISPVLSHMFGEQQRKKYGILSTWFHSIAQINKDIQPKELPKKIHKKFQKKKEKGEQGKEGEKGEKGGKQEHKDEKAGGDKNKGKQQKKQQKQEQNPNKKKDKKKEKQQTTETKQKTQQPKDDLFGSDEETAPKPAQKKPEPKKQAKKKPAAKSIVVFNVKVFEQEQDLHALAEKIKKQTQMDGLVWNSDIEIKPVAYGMNMLQLGCVIEDEKVSIEEDVYNKISAWETEIQSVDTVSFQKL